jgi:hypothetical protein
VPDVDAAHEVSFLLIFKKKQLPICNYNVSFLSLNHNLLPMMKRCPFTCVKYNLPDRYRLQVSSLIPADCGLIPLPKTKVACSDAFRTEQ